MSETIQLPLDPGTKLAVTIASIAVVHVDGPKKFLGRSASVILEKIISAPRGTAARRLVIAEIKDVLVIQPGVVARIVIKVTHIRAVCANGVGLEKFVDWVLQETDEALARRAPPFAKDVEVVRGRNTLREGNGSHLTQGHDQLRIAAIQIHLPNAGLV